MRSIVWPLIGAASVALNQMEYQPGWPYAIAVVCVNVALIVIAADVLRECWPTVRRWIAR